MDEICKVETCDNDFGEAAIYSNQKWRKEGMEEGGNGGKRE